MSFKDYVNKDSVKKLNEEKSPEERLAISMLKILKQHAKENNITNIRNVVSDMLSKVN